MYHEILLPVDGSDAGRGAIHRALALASKHAARVHAVHVVETDRYGEPARSSTELLVDDLEDAGNEHLDEVRAIGEARGVEVTTRCCHGHAAEEILGHAAAVDADLVVMGATGASGKPVGNVTRAVAQDCGTDVLAI